MSCIFLQFDLEKFISKNCKYIFFYQKICTLGRKYFCLPGSNSKQTDKHAADSSKAVCLVDK